MVISKIRGGLGNQMFQYAAARRLAHTLKTELYLDISEFTTNWIRSYNLKHFRIQVQSDNAQRIFRLSDPALNTPPLTVIREEPQQYAQVLNAGDNSYLLGYWQSEKYFSDIQDIIRKEFTIKETLRSKSARLLDKIHSVNSVAVHVRRGDYASVKEVNKLFGTCDLDYYKKSAEYIGSRVENPHFFIFSDDPQWVKKNFTLPFPISIIDHNYYWRHSPLESYRIFRMVLRAVNLKAWLPDRSYEDIMLMSQCQHCITANSTFSWWGAWLGQNPHKIICSPKNWFSTPNEYGQTTPPDLIPDSWVRL